MSHRTNLIDLDEDDSDESDESTSAIVNKTNTTVQLSCPNYSPQETYSALRMIKKIHKPVSRPHYFTEDEQEKMQDYESLCYSEQITLRFRKHLCQSGPGKVGRHHKWIVVFLVGVVIALLAFTMTQTVEAILNFKGSQVSKLVKSNTMDKSYIQCWIFLLTTNTILALLASAAVVFGQPAFGGGGIPEVMAELNGVHIPGAFRVRTLCVKIASIVLAVAADLPVGMQAPLVHIGAMVGIGMAQGRSRSLRFQSTLALFQSFRNNRDRNDFLCAGSAAGVTAAFCSPIGGLLLVMESMASWWNQAALTAVIFFTCLATSYTLLFLQSTFDGWKLTTNGIGYLNFNIMSIFAQPFNFPLHIFSIFPAILLGIICGVFGSFWTITTLTIGKFRAKWIVKHRIRRLLEVMCIAIIFTTACVLLPMLFKCEPVTEGIKNLNWVTGICGSDDEYNPLAVLSFKSSKVIVNRLLSTNTTHTFPYSVLGVYFLVYFFSSAVTSGSALCCGIVIPSMVMGALIGRIFGNILHDCLTEWHLPVDWLDPGVLSYLGAAAFMASVTRLTVALTVILIEMSGDVHHSFALMIAVQVAMWIGNNLCHSLYSSQLESKCVPFLPDGHILSTSLHVFNARDIMSTDLTVVTDKEYLTAVIEALHTTHNAFPVVRDKTSMKLVGIITRNELVDVLERYEQDNCTNSFSKPISIVATYEEMRKVADRRYLVQRRSSYRTLHAALGSSRIVLDLSQSIDLCPFVVSPGFSLLHVYRIFRTLGLRHLLVVKGHRVVGVITRKNLLPQNLERLRETMPPPDEFNELSEP